jgi:hypothetical protein
MDEFIQIPNLKPALETYAAHVDFSPRTLFARNREKRSIYKIQQKIVKSSCTAGPWAGVKPAFTEEGTWIRLLSICTDIAPPAVTVYSGGCG